MANRVERGFFAPVNRLALGASCIVMVAASASTAHADYLLDLTSGGQQELTLAPGNQFALEVMLRGVDRHNSCLFSLLFTEPGLSITGYQWASPYETNSLYEYSQPGLSDLPAVVSPSLFIDPFAPDLNDVSFSNVVDPALSNAGEGMLLRVNITIPSDYSGASRLFGFAIPDTFARGFDVVPTTLGLGVTLNIIPSPGALLIAPAAMLFARRRRSK